MPVPGQCQRSGIHTTIMASHIPGKQVIIKTKVKSINKQTNNKNPQQNINYFVFAGDIRTAGLGSVKISCFLPYIKVTIIFRWKKYYPDTFTNEIKRPHGEVRVYTPRHSSRHASDHVLCQGHQGRILCRHHVHRSCIIIACRALGNISRHRESLCVIVRVVSVCHQVPLCLCVSGVSSSSSSSPSHTSTSGYLILSFSVLPST